MKNLVFIGSHLGYPMERTPLGGGAMVGLQLARRWAAAEGVRLTVLGSGSRPPDPAMTYIQLPAPGPDPDLVRLSELGYARFCREFEAAATEYLVRGESLMDPRATAVVVNDISESPDLACAARLGYRIMSIWHVDVVDFFNRIYLRGWLAPERLTRAFTRVEDLGLGRLVPDVLKLVFQKQREAVERSDRLILPSRRMAETIQRCYGHLPTPGKRPLASRVRVVPWGGWREEHPEAETAAEASRLKARYRIGQDTAVLMTLSRISPEKGIAILLEALGLLERSGRLPARDLCVLVCGEPAFMRGESYGRQVRAAAARLSKVRVFFPGYLSSEAKQAHFRLAHLFVSASVHESYGLTLVEAMQGGLPILASDHYGVEEIVSPEWGVRVPYGRASRRPADMAAALRSMLADRGRLAAMGEAARRASAGMTFSEASRTLLEEALAMTGDA